MLHALQTVTDYVPVPAVQKATLERKDSELPLQPGCNSTQVLVRASPGIDASSTTPPNSTTTAVSTVEQQQTLKTQAGALLRKNAVFQRRNLGTNICLLASPIIFCVLLLVVQVALNRLLTGNDYKVCVVPDGKRHYPSLQQ